MDSADQNPDSKPSTGKRKPLIVNPHQKRSVTIWILPLVLIIAVIVFLPHLMERFF